MQQHVEHIVHGYDEDLNTLTSALSEMGWLCATLWPLICAA